MLNLLVGILPVFHCKIFNRSLKNFVMLIINNTQNNIHINKSSVQSTSLSSLPEWQQKLHDLFQYYIEHTSPKQLGRSLRTYFLLHVAEMKTVTPQWEDLVLHFIAMLELMDDVEDIANET